MYLNFNLYPEQLFPEDLFYLLAIKQVNMNIVVPDDVLSRFETLSLVKYVKGKAKEEKRLKLRISDKGKDLLVKLSFEGSYDLESEKLADWLISIYRSKGGGMVKNKVEVKRRLHWWKKITDIRGNFLAVLLQCAIQDSYNPESDESFFEFKKKNPRAIWSNMAENLLWKPGSIHDKYKTLDKSPLYMYYEDNKEYIENIWRTKLNADGSVK